MISFAGPGFRTIEVRYMLEDDFTETDDYMFHPSHLYSVGDPASQEFRAAYKKAVAEADLITLGVGGNDWGAYLGWVMTEVQDNNKLPDEYVEELKSYLKTASFDDNIIAEIVNLAHQMNALDELIEAIPEAVMYGFGTYMENWDYLIQDIYDLNPDVTLVVVGMYSSKYSTTKEAPDVVIESEPFKAAVEQMIIDYANKPMIESKDKFGYIYVDTEGTIVEVSHPNVAGNRFIADRILEALPDARFDLTDINASNDNYKAVEYMYLNGLINGTADKTFNGDAAMTKTDFSALMRNYNTIYPASTSTKAVTLMEVKLAAFITAENKTITDLFNLLKYFTQIFFTNDAFAPATRTQVATEFYSYVK